MVKAVAKKSVKTVTPRKAPKQTRARETCHRILQGTRTLLEQQGAAAVTTRNIATASGVNISSIYQYYPNKQAILYALVQERLQVEITIFDEFDTEEHLSKPGIQYIPELMSALYEQHLYSKMDLELDKAIGHDVKLNTMMERHIDIVVTRMASLLRHFGCSWPKNKLHGYAEYMYEVGDAQMRLNCRDNAHSAPYISQWAQDHGRYLVEYCLSS